MKMFMGLLSSPLSAMLSPPQSLKSISRTTAHHHNSTPPLPLHVLRLFNFFLCSVCFIYCLLLPAKLCLFHFHLSGAFLEPDAYSQELTLKVTNNSICSFSYQTILECSVSFRIQIKRSSSSLLMTGLALCKVAAFKQSKYFMKTISTTLLNE